MGECLNLMIMVSIFPVFRISALQDLVVLVEKRPWNHGFKQIVECHVRIIFFQNAGPNYYPVVLIMSWYHVLTMSCPKICLDH